ncbi:MAG TPA: DUF523 and DUF1722 domain-containing protein [Myxococcota bacterium]|nr:DUF523 and DUF1722 domain-containing protein [Myxococcota bacterium]
MSDTTAPLRLGISACLLGKPVRFDGGHKRDPFLSDTLSQWVEWVSVCPEVGAGLGTPRPTLRLVGIGDAPRLVAPKTGLDHTAAMEAYSRKELKRLARLDLCGFVLKSKSPSCGMERVKVYNASMPTKGGVGLFAQALMAALPLLPVEEEGRLHDPVLRENFLERVFTYKRWRDFCRGRASRARLVHFHAIHKFLVLAHSPKHYTELGQLVGNMVGHPISELYDAYGALLMRAMAVRSTRRKHTNVLQHLAGFFKKQLDAAGRAELVSVIEDFHAGLVPLVVPVTLLAHHVRAFDVKYLAEQLYLSPAPKELMLRNHG